MRKTALLLFAVCWLPVAAFAGPAEEANAVVQRWSAAYSSNNPEAIAQVLGEVARAALEIAASVIQL
jgi:hypothetical protein